MISYRTVDVDDALSRRLRARFAELETERRVKADELARLQEQSPVENQQADLLGRIPCSRQRLGRLQEDLQRELFSVFRLAITYDPTVCAVQIKITLYSEPGIRGERVPG
ncbi:hypothetical protein ACIBHX_20205 [Nonomuraea sp. NPDC050536]|uniref:hypothetical protein n=1 Tax=Nonomuraea sp. NPDC050536 TaxID=3364366 RepID=UPI0037C7D257